MHLKTRLLSLGVCASLLSLCACASLSPHAPLVTRQLQWVSAGHTGCLPEANDISNVTTNLDGSGLWNATCKGRIYLCSAVATASQAEAFSCAPVAQ